MNRPRLTQVFPFLLPARSWQKRKIYRLKMALDKNVYASDISDDELPVTICKHKSLLLRKLGDSDIQLQINKVTNLKLCAQKIDHLVIKPSETFSFWYLMNNLDKSLFKDGILLSDGKVKKGPGGGICQLGNLLYWMFLHTPLTVVERHRHGFDPFPDYGRVIPFGTGATLSEGWLDLKVRNDTNITFQILVYFNEDYIRGKILATSYPDYKYHIKEQNSRFIKRKNGNYRYNEIVREWTNRKTGLIDNKEFLYQNDCLVVYELDPNIKLETE